MLRKHGDTVMIDATHNGAKGLNGSKAYLYTLVVKNRMSNRGTLVSFMITESASQYVQFHVIRVQRLYIDMHFPRYPVEVFLKKLF
jgi:hypothetical protein